MNAEEYENVCVRLRALDEQERLLWQRYAEQHTPSLLDKIAELTAEKDAIYGNPQRTGTL